MSPYPLLPQAQRRRLSPLFPRSRGLRRVDCRWVVSGIIDVISAPPQMLEPPTTPGPFTCQRARGAAQRVRPIPRERGYHGVSFGGMSVDGIGANRKQFGAVLLSLDHLPGPHALEHQAFSRDQPEYGAHFADALVALVALHGDIEAVSPPLIVEKPHVERLSGTLADAIRAEVA